MKPTKITKTFSIDPEVYKRLKGYAGYQGVTVGEAIKILLDTQQIPSPPAGPGYAEWLMEMLRIGNERGEAAAMKYLKENPYKRPVDGE